MTLRTVTISGADDAVDVRDLAALSLSFPFVEWGLLFSAKREGTPRYPTAAWRDKLRTALRSAVATYPHQISIHLCGQAARDTMAGDVRWLTEILRCDRRVQLNGWTPSPDVEHQAALHALARSLPPTCPRGLPRRPEFILQVRHEDLMQAAANEARFLVYSASALFDPSGGRGLEAFRWPVAPIGLKLGYAGGIKPSTVEAVLTEITLSRGTNRNPYWIDMESGVRDGADRFDLGLVRQVLESCAKWIDR